MGMRGIIVAAVVAGLTSGCASGRTRKEVVRLESQFGLLDERVTQLERTSLSAATPTWGAESSAADSGASAGARPAPKSSRAPSGQTPAATSIKPATREIQQALKNAGFYQGAVDGKTGPMTREAVKEFQRVHGLTDDGVVGKRTWAKLHAYADLSSSSGELNAAEVLK